MPRTKQPQYQTVSVAAPTSVAERLKQRLPKRGDRSKLLLQTIKMFLDGHIEVYWKGRRL